MLSWKSTLLWTCLMLGACAPMETTSKPRQAAPTPDPSAPFEDAVRTNGKDESNLSASELQVWNDPQFKKQLIESYIAQTEIEPEVNQVERGQLQEIFDLMAIDELDQAVQKLGAMRSDVSSAVFDFTLATIHLQREEFEEAVRPLEIAVEKHPKFLRAWQNLGMVYFRTGRHADALESLTKVIVLGEGNATTYGMLGFCYAEGGNSLSAETAYRLAILLDPVTVDWKRGLAMSLFRQNRYEEAVALFETLIAEQPENADLWLAQARAYLRIDPLKAAENFEMVRHLGKASPQSLYTLGDIYTNERLYGTAARTYLSALDGGGDPARALRAATDLGMRGAIDEIGDLLDRIEGQHLDSLDEKGRTDLLHMRARIAMSHDATEEHVAILEKIVENDPLDGEALIQLGDHYRFNASDIERAAFFYERAEKVEASEAKAKLRHAELLVSQGKFREALPLLRRAQDLNPRDDVKEYLERVERRSKSRS